MILTVMDGCKHLSISSIIKIRSSDILNNISIKSKSLAVPSDSSFKSKNILNQISGNALKLYIFFGISSHNETGESWYSLEYIAKYFGKSTRTISNWILELEKVKLIKRIQLERDGVAHTFLKPY